MPIDTTCDEYVQDSISYGSSSSGSEKRLVGSETTYKVPYTKITKKQDVLSNKTISMNVKQNDILKKGKISYMLDDTMKVNKIYRASICISQMKVKNSNIITFQKKLVIISNNNSKDLHTLKYQIDTIKIGDKMKISLIDPTNNSFNISNLSNDTQTIDFSQDSIFLWQWDIMPLKGGNKILNFSVVITQENGDVINIPVYSKNIKVKVDIITQTRTFLDFLKNYWMIFTGVGSIISFLFIYFKKKKSGKK